MAVPKRKHSTHRKGIRRSHLAIKSTYTGKCPKCSADHLPHTICGNCGHYRDENVINLED